MITFIGIALLVVAFSVEGQLRKRGLYDLYTSRSTDWLVIVPGMGGIGCLVYVFYVMCARLLP